MKNIVFAFCLVALTGSYAASAQSPAQLRLSIWNAHTSGQSNRPAEYYAQEQKKCLQRANEEKQLWDQRSQHVTASAAKYPRPVDSARYLHDYYAYRATEMGALAGQYSQPAASATNIAAR